VHLDFTDHSVAAFSKMHGFASIDLPTLVHVHIRIYERATGYENIAMSV